MWISGIETLSFARLSAIGDFMKFNAKDYSQGDIIRIIRGWSGLTQKDFAKVVGKSKRTIEQYEVGTVNYNINFIQKMSKEFDIDIVFTKSKKNK